MYLFLRWRSLSPTASKFLTLLRTKHFVKQGNFFNLTKIVKGIAYKLIDFWIRSKPFQFLVVLNNLNPIEKYH